ncbi:DMT family transporter [candidate division WOR-3 bacterium]|nr:DMT family transporter [candidate division WOR-3 bacterium]
MKTHTTRSVFLAFIAMTLWSTVATAFSIALKNTDFYEVLFISINTSTVVLFAAVLVTGKLKKIFNLKSIYKSSIYGILNPFIYYIVLFKAYSLLKIQVAQGLNYTWPIVLSVLSLFFLKQNMKIKDFIALFLSFTGALILIFGTGQESLGQNNFIGVCLGILSSLIWSFFWIFNIKDKRDDVVKMFLNFLFGSIYVTILFFITRGTFVSLNTGFYSSVYIGLFEMSLTFIIWIFALKNSDKTSRVSNIIYLTPFLSLVFIHFIGQEKIKLTTVVGLIIILIGIFIQNLDKKKCFKLQKSGAVL